MLPSCTTPETCKKQKFALWDEIVDDTPVILHKKSSELTVAIDIDKCAAVGGDTNDILRIILAKYPDARVSMRKELEAVGKAIINPRMVEAIKAIEREVPGLNIVAYTQKSNTFRVMRCQGVKIPEIKRGTMHLASDSVSCGPDYLCKQCPTTDEQLRSYNELLRIGIITQAMAAVLGREVSPAVYVTEEKKDLRVLAEHLGIDGKKLFLFDDSAKKHIDLLTPDIKSCGKPADEIEHEIKMVTTRMIPVEEYEFTSNDPHAEELRCVLEAHFPMKGLKETNPKEYNEIINDPGWPKQNRCISAEEEWVVHYSGMREPVAAWDTAPVLAAIASAFRI